MGKKEEQDEFNKKLVEKSFKSGDADKDWEKEETISNPAHEPDPADDLPPVD